MCALRLCDVCCTEQPVDDMVMCETSTCESCVCVTCAKKGHIFRGWWERVNNSEDWRSAADNRVHCECCIFCTEDPEKRNVTDEQLRRYLFKTNAMSRENVYQMMLKSARAAAHAHCGTVEELAMDSMLNVAGIDREEAVKRTAVMVCEEDKQHRLETEAYHEERAHERANNEDAVETDASGVHELNGVCASPKRKSEEQPEDEPVAKCCATDEQVSMPEQQQQPQDPTPPTPPELEPELVCNDCGKGRMYRCEHCSSIWHACDIVYCPHCTDVSCMSCRGDDDDDLSTAPKDAHGITISNCCFPFSASDEDSGVHQTDDVATVTSTLDDASGGGGGGVDIEPVVL